MSPVVEPVWLVVVPVRNCIEVDPEPLEPTQIQPHQTVELFEVEGPAGNGLVHEQCRERVKPLMPRQVAPRPVQPLLTFNHAVKVFTEQVDEPVCLELVV